MVERVKTAVIDLDNTIASYDHWRGADHIGEPIPYAREAIEELRTWGWRIVVFTTRGDANFVRAWLNKNHIQVDGVNTTDHNPTGTSSKPIADVYFDDRDCHVVGERPFNWHKAMRRVRRRYQPTLCVEIDDAAAWSSCAFRFWHWWRSIVRDWNLSVEESIARGDW
jgi:hypothetical protein